MASTVLFHSVLGLRPLERGVGHLFLDPSLPDYDAVAADLCLGRAFLGRL